MKLEDIIKKISKYDMLVDFVPGGMFVYLMSQLLKINLLIDNIVIDLCVIYVMGVVSEFVGNILIAILCKLRIIKYIEYKEYIRANKNISIIRIISRRISMYKALSGTLIIILLFFICNFGKSNYNGIICVLGLLIFLIILVTNIVRQLHYLSPRIKQIKNDKRKRRLNK